MEKLLISYNVGTARMFYHIIETEISTDLEEIVKKLIDRNIGWFIDINSIKASDINDYDNEQWFYVDNTDSKVENKKSCYYFYVVHMRIEDYNQKEYYYFKKDEVVEKNKIIKLVGVVDNSIPDSFELFTNYISTKKEFERLLKNNDEEQVLYTTQLDFLNFSRSDEIYLLYKNKEYQLTLGECIGTKKIIREAHDLNKLIKGGTFDFIKE